MANSRDLEAGFAPPLATQPLVASPEGSRPDGWTVVSTAISGITSFISNAFWIGGIIDTIGDLDDIGIGISWWGVGFGTGISLGIAIGAAYAQGVQNYQFQEEPRRSMINATRMLGSEVYHRMSSHDETLQNDHADDSSPPQTRHRVTPRSQETDALVPVITPTRLSLFQKGAIGAYAISYIGDIAGVLTFVIRIGAADKIPLYGELLVQAGVISTGALGSIADVRTIRKNMLLFAEKRAEKQRLLTTSAAPLMN